MNTLETYNKELLKKRTWVSKIPDSKKAVMLISGGYDSIMTSARLIKDFGMELFPIYIDRGSRNREGELASIKFFTEYFQKRFGKNSFHEVFIPSISIPPKEIKEKLQEYAKAHRYPMRDFITQMFAAQYAVSIGDDVRTICNGVIETDSIASVVINRINTLAICEMTKEPEWNILSINIDPEISNKPFSKHDEIKWANVNQMPGEKTMTCWTPVQDGNELFHCGECYACAERKKGFIDANIKDDTKYFNKRSSK
jgi:7-cyano-7-deazaguanine synthase in queuosine biosynthesis